MQKPETSSASPGSRKPQPGPAAKLAKPASPPSSDGEGRPAQKRRDLLLCLGLVALTLAVYWPVHHFEFINYDDAKYVTENVWVKMGLTAENAAWAFRTFYLDNWHPLTWLSFMLDDQLFGMNPGAFHLVNLFFHTLNALLLFIVLKKMTRALWPSAFVAAVFAVHPLHVESVAWVAERKDVLSGFFWMLTLWAYARFAKRPGIWPYLLALSFFALGLMAKPMLVTLPFVLLLLDVWPLGRFPSQQVNGSSLHTRSTDPRERPLRIVLEKVPFLLLTAVSCVLTYLAQDGARVRLRSLPLPERIGNAMVSYGRYLGKTLWPQDLAIHYPHPGQWPIARIAGVALLLGAVTVWVLAQLRKRPYLALGWFWFIGTLVPVIGLVQVGAQSMADRYMYIPQIGLLIMLAWGASEAAALRTLKQGTLIFGASAAIFACVWLSSWQVRFWRGSKPLFEHALAVTGGSAVGHNNLGDALLAEGKTNEALAHYTAALQIEPDSYWAYSNLGNFLLNQGRTEEAIAKYRKGLELNPRSPELNHNLGLALAKQRKPAEAVRYYEEALRFKADYASELECADAYLNLGNALADLGKFEEAIASYTAALPCKPKAALAQLNIGSVLTQQGKHQEAATRYQAALRLDPNNAQAHCNLALCLSGQGKHLEAIAELTEALRLEPDDSEFHFHFATVLDAARKPREAAAQYREALRLNPDSVLALNNLAWLLATRDALDLRDGAEAVKYAERACQLTGNKQSFLVGTLAAAYAEAGRFPEAVSTAQKAAELAAAAGQKEIAARNQGLLELYRSGKPYRESP